MPPWAVFVALLNLLWVVPVVKIIFIDPTIEQKKRNDEWRRQRKEWETAHPGAERILCINCRYCKTTTWFTSYHGSPQRYPVYCRLMREELQSGLMGYDRMIRCRQAAPSDEFIVKGKTIYPDFKVYYSPYGGCYHSTLRCPSLQSAKTIQWATKDDNSTQIWERRPCPKCCKVDNDKILPRYAKYNESK